MPQLSSLRSGPSLPRLKLGRSRRQSQGQTKSKSQHTASHPLIRRRIDLESCVKEHIQASKFATPCLKRKYYKRIIPPLGDSRMTLAEFARDTLFGDLNRNVQAAAFAVYAGLCDSLFKIKRIEQQHNFVPTQVHQLMEQTLTKQDPQLLKGFVYLFQQVVTKRFFCSRPRLLKRPSSIWGYLTEVSSYYLLLDSRLQLGAIPFSHSLSTPAAKKSSTPQMKAAGPHH